MRRTRREGDRMRGDIGHHFSSSTESGVLRRRRSWQGAQTGDARGRAGGKSRADELDERDMRRQPSCGCAVMVWGERCGETGFVVGTSSAVRR